MALIQKDNKLGFMFKVTDSRGITSEEFCELEEETISTQEYEYSDIYHNEDLKNVDEQIENTKDYISELEFSKEDLINTIEQCYNQIRLQNDLYHNQNSISKLQDELKAKYYNFYNTLGDECEFTIINTYKGFTFDEDSLTFENDETVFKESCLNNASNANACLDAFSKLYRQRSDDILKSNILTLREINNNTTFSSIDGTLQTILKYECNLAFIERKIEYYQEQQKAIK